MPGDPSRSHLPAPSYWPIVLSLAFPLIGYGLIFNMTLAGIGGAVLLAGMVGWALEPPDDEDLPPARPRRPRRRRRRRRRRRARARRPTARRERRRRARAEPEEVTAGD